MGIMANFEYQALNSAGKTVKGSHEAETARQVRQTLREQGLTPLDVQSVATKKGSLLTTDLFMATIKVSDLSLMTRQLCTLLDAGMPLTESLNAVAKQADSKQMQRFVDALYTKVSEGHSYAQALKLAPYKISEDYIATIRAGEESGNLDNVLSRLAESIEKQDKIQKKMKTAMVYPVLMVVISVVIIFFLMAFVVPKVVGVFEHMEQDLPPLTQNMIVLSDFVQSQWGLILVVLFAVWLFYKLLMRRDTWRYRRDQMLLSVPALRKFLIYSATARWARTLGVLHASGVAITDALKISSEVMTLLPLKKKVVKMGEEVREGKKLHFAMKEAGFFPPLLLNLVQTGEGQGQVDTMLLKGAEHYEQEVETAASTLTSLLEPIMIVIMGGVVLTIVLAIMLPIFEMNKMVG